jgi:hypothetical protein
MSAPIDFNKIRGDMPEGQRGAFEELVCQLVRRQAPDPRSYRRIEGAGGDGGVECIHRAASGGIVGYQAKYYTSPGKIDWQAIDRSVNTALSTYSDLVTYVIAIACDFTGTRRIKGGIISDGTWGEWDRHVEKWRAQATSNGRSIEFVPWTVNELTSFLMPVNAGGLRAYWFSGTEFSHSWFRKHVELAVANLDERYNPEDHVNVEIQLLFEFITRNAKVRGKLSDQFKVVKAHSFPDQRLLSGALKLPDELIREALVAIQKVMDIEPELTAPPWQVWNVNEWAQLVLQAANKVRDVGECARNAHANFKGPEQENTRRDLQSADDALGELYYKICGLEYFMTGHYMKAETKRAALIAGRAGTGKSHLLACIAELAVNDNRPVVFILGQQIREQALWPQILERLGLLNVTAEDFLSALEATAESNGQRGLILVDAINEGAGVRVWRDEIRSFLAQIANYPNLACVLSCRSEYVDYLVPKAVLDTLPFFEVRGFETPEEQANAARVYLDKRGISRPATPWLAPEFVNPLFLRSCCNALQREKKVEFPRGLTGTKEIFAFYLNSAAKHLGVGRDGADDLVGPTKATLLQIATEMAENRKDYLLRKRAEEIANTIFSLFSTPPTSTWLEVLQRNGLLRFDPDPTAKPTDPLQEPAEVVRFSFQRFQDHLMAETLLARVNDVKAALTTGGFLSFIHDGKQVCWEWRGLVEALSAQLPDRFQIELVDALPGKFDIWWPFQDIQNAFIESVRLRSTSAFTQRTVELFNGLVSEWDRLFLLFDLSASIDHPWNAEFIHRNLIHRTMAKRDAFWTVEVNKTTDAELHPLNRLVDWCLSAKKIRAMPETLWLCALVLTWCFTSSNRQIRDRATKALTIVLLDQPDIFPRLADAFRDVDDLYVLERLYAAAYGACCTGPSNERMDAYTQTTYINLFSQRAPLPNLLLRDYARGIIELSNHIGALPKGIDITRCQPPYVSALAKLTASDATLKKLADKAGDKSILNSCDHWGDFGRYEIEPPAGKFVAVKLSSPAPYSSREKFERFEKEVVKSHSDRIHALARLQRAVSNGTLIHIQYFGQTKKKPRKPTKDETRKHTIQIRTAEKKFLELLTPHERKRYRAEARPWVRIGGKKKNGEPRQVDIAAAKRWVAKKAYDFGWNKQLFRQDSGSHFEYKSDRALVERIGKKYQWLALSELLCRLADNFWIGGAHGDKTRKYDNPNDLGLLRDIDPTVLPHQCANTKERDELDSWIRGPDIIIPPTSEDQLTKWPFSADPGALLPSLIHRTDTQARKWITLYDHRSASEKYEPRGVMQHGFRQQEFRFVLSVIVSRANTARFIEQVKKGGDIDVMQWDAPDVTDGPYLREGSWRRTWDQTQWQTDCWRTRQAIPIAFPISNYICESHLDGSLPKGAHTFVPSPWLMVDLELSLDIADVSICRDSSGKPQFVASNRRLDGSSAVIEAEMLNAHLDCHQLDCVWLFVAERSAYPGGDNDKAAWRRTEGICWIEGGKPNATTWNEDRVNGK